MVVPHKIAFVNMCVCVCVCACLSYMLRMTVRLCACLYYVYLNYVISRAVCVFYIVFSIKSVLDSYLNHAAFYS